MDAKDHDSRTRVYRYAMFRHAGSTSLRGLNGTCVHPHASYCAFSIRSTRVNLLAVSLYRHMVLCSAHCGRTFRHLLVLPAWLRCPHCLQNWDWPLLEELSRAWKAYTTKLDSNRPCGLRESLAPFSRVSHHTCTCTTFSVQESHWTKSGNWGGVLYWNV